MFTYEELVSSLPKKQKTLVTEHMVDLINTVAEDEAIGEEFHRNFVTYTNVISKGKFTLQEYRNAIHFVTMILLEETDIDAYMKVFPDRYLRLTVEKGLSRKQISPYANAFKNTDLVTMILEQTLVPTHIVNAPMYQEALNHQRYLMLNARSEMVQHQAAKTIMEQLKQPEVAKLEVDITTRNETVEENEAFMIELAEKKLELMRLGGDVKSITNMTVKKENIIDGEVVE